MGITRSVPPRECDCRGCSEPPSRGYGRYCRRCGISVGTHGECREHLRVVQSSAPQPELVTVARRPPPWQRGTND